MLSLDLVESRYYLMDLLIMREAKLLAEAALGTATCMEALAPCWEGGGPGQNRTYHLKGLLA